MAKVVIVFKDTKDGKGVKTSVRFDPPIEVDDVATNAQSFGLQVLEEIRKQGEDAEDEQAAQDQ